MTLAMALFGILLVIAAGGVVTARSPLNSALWLVVSLFLVAIHFAMLDAHFMAAMQILVYAGAIMVLVIFVIMLLGLEPSDQGDVRRRFVNACAGVISGLFFALLYLAINQGVPEGLSSLVALDASPSSAGVVSEQFGTTEAVGEAMFTRFVFPFQIIGALLLAAIIGAVLLAFEEVRPLGKGRGLAAVRRGED